MSGSDFTVDTDTLVGLVRRMSACEQTLEHLTNAVERDVARLHETWRGKAAQAQRLAHAEWEKGLRTMREAIAVLRHDAQLAHDNYHGAGETNLEMWRAVT